MWWPRIGGVGGQAQRLQHLDLLVADRLGVEARGRLHRHQREQLQHVVLQHVADRARGVVVAAAAALHADRLGHGDLHEFDVLLVPQRFEEGVAEAEHQQVLHRLLAQVVVDAVELVLADQLEQVGIERERAGQVGAEGLLDHHAALQPRALVEQPGLAQVLHRGQAQLRLHGQVEDAVRGPAGDLVEALAQRLVVGGGLEVGLHVAGQAQEGLPALGVVVLGLGHRGVQLLAEAVVVPRPARHADELEAAREELLAVRGVERRHQLARGRDRPTRRR